ncbi:MAG: cation-binding protein [Candidatus Moranbacteria bacterium CG_4_9_14_3_um_filter_42_9]|nr:MAG: cation-binding protein [Candidatus Moranbacteria bacterium CG_4_9_14_3_um_filter_42_9]
MEKQTRVLSREHEAILKVIKALERERDELKSGKKVNEEFFDKALEFIKNYADKFHHAKEENILFVEFCKNAHKAHCNPVEQMLYEHKLGREFVKGMEIAMKETDLDGIVKNAESYANLLEEHIFKEDTILYPMMDEVFDKKTQRLIAENAQAAEKKFKKEDLERYLAFANNLKG